MKKILSSAFIFILCIILCSCSENVKINKEIFDEGFRKDNRRYFYNADCNHVIAHSKITDDGGDYSPSEYHIVSCAYGNCDFEQTYEKHSPSSFIVRVIREPKILSNGLLYHEIKIECTECGSLDVVRFRLCKAQDISCNGSCLDFCEKEAYPCDTQ